MKKIFYIILVLIVLPFLKVDALKCYSELIDVSKTHSITCVEVEGEELTFKDSTNKEDYNNFFTYSIDKDAKTSIVNISENVIFDKIFPSGLIEVNDGNSSAIIKIKNKAYEEPTTIVTTTTKNINAKTFKVTLNPNNGDNIIEKTCEVNRNNETCSVTLPNLDKENFNGWGTAKTCKEGNSGTIKIDKNITYYACYKNNDISTTTINDANIDLYLKTLSLSDKNTNEIIDFGTFSIKKKEYSLKVLNEVDNIDVNATSDENVIVDISGNENLVVGENKIIIKLTDSNNNQTEYILNVKRLNEGEKINKIHYLKSLVIGGYNIDFNKEKLVYTITIPSDIDKLEITAIQEDEEDKVEILNNKELIDGSQILINVLDENNEKTTYIINIAKESSMNYLLLVGIGLIVVLIIVLIILIIIKSKKNNNKKSSKEKIEVLNI